MKKFLGITILSLVFYVNPLTISDSNAGWFSDPMEKCMDRVLKFSFDNDKEKTANAAAYCKSASSSSLKCMDRVLKFSFANNKKKISKCSSTLWRFNKLITKMHGQST